MRNLKVTQSITLRDSLSLEKYLAEVSRIQLLTLDEETALAIQIKSGDEKALQTLTKANLRFVVSVAKQYQFRGMPLVDLINEGNIGLIRAAQNFDETKGFKFISYAVWWIRQSIMQALNDKARMVRLPSNKAALLNKVAHSVSVLSQSLEREPDIGEIAVFINVAKKEIEVLEAAHFHLSLDAPLHYESGATTMLEQLPAADNTAADKKVQRDSLSFELDRCLATLPEIQCKILQMFFGMNGTEPMSLSMIGTQLKLSDERVRQIKQKALSHMSTGKKRLLLQAYLA